ncbi:MAG: DMT family transporter [Sphingobacteriales bacterium]|jgi:drug/metabolite transporter (DMT)-like permease|nr:DMT family transporter [Sphingobacteriales bacterium]
MIYLVLSIVFSTLTVSFFKVFHLKKVNTFQAIVVNYLTCGVIGTYLAKTPVYSVQFWQAPWLLYTVILGFLFISIFYLIALTAQKMSVAASMVSAKLSVVIPVLLAWQFLSESLSLTQIIGILISFIAVFFISARSEPNPEHANKEFWFLPILVFLGSGCIDALLKFLESRYIPAYSSDDIVTATFLFAFVFGSLSLLVQQIKLKESIQVKSLAWGLLLGIPNYFSMYFLVETLAVFPASFIFPINNIGIVAFSTVLAFWAFSEKLSVKNYIGLGLAIASILLISFA